MKKRYIGAVLFVLFFIVYRFIPSSDAFPPEQINALSFLFLCMILWFTEFIPLGASALLILALPFVMGMSTLKETLVPFPNPIIFFVIATFALSGALTKVPLAKRLLLFLLKTAGGSVNLFLLAVMSATFLISSIMSNIPATAMFIPICMSFLECYERDEDKKSAGRAFMIGLAVAGMVGGTITPAGSSNNLISLSILEETGGVAIRFIDWMLICAPIAFIILPISWLLIVLVFKPAKIEKAKIDSFRHGLEALPRPDAKEIIVGAVMLTMIVLWVLSSWYPRLDTSIVAIAGMAVMFLPGIDIFTWKEFSKEVSWAVVLMVGSVLCVGGILIKSGVAGRLGDLLFSVTPGMSAAVLILKLALFICVMQLLIPNGPAVIASTTPLVIAAANAVGINPAMLTIPLCVLASWTIIIPLSAVPMVTYSFGYYKVTDIGKVGVPVLAIVTLIMCLWIPFITSVVL